MSLPTAKNKEKALWEFWSSFGWAAYDENSVPDEAELPYITYENITANIGAAVFLTASLWDRSESWASVTNKGVDIARELSYGGKTIKYDNGLLFVTQGKPFSQRIADDNKLIRRLDININAEFLSAD